MDCEGHEEVGNMMEVAVLMKRKLEEGEEAQHCPQEKEGRYEDTCQKTECESDPREEK